MVKHRTPKVEFPSDGGDLEKVRWLMNTVKVYPSKHTITVVCYTSPAGSERLCEWLTSHEAAPPTRHESGRQIQHSLGIAFVDWLTRKALEHGIASPSPFQSSLDSANKIANEFRREIDLHRDRLMELLAKRDGVKRCRRCGCLDRRVLEFDHILPETKKHQVCDLLFAGKWAEAEAEAMFCQILCKPCHIEKTTSTGRKKPPRKPTADAKTQSHREAVRRNDLKRREHGRQREREAKLRVGKCAGCSKICTKENLHDFEWDHGDPATKCYSMSQMTLWGDKAFNIELAKCRLLCTLCHKEHTQHQYDTGVFDALRTKRKLEDTDGVHVEKRNRGEGVG